MKSYFLNIRATAIILFLLFSFSSFSQNRLQIIEMEREATANFQLNNFHYALPLLLKLDSLKPNTENYLYPIGVCYLAIEDNQNALRYLEKCIKVSDKHPAALNYYLGKAYHLSHKFDEAISRYTIYRDEFKANKSKSSKQLEDEVERDIEMCKNGKALIQDSLELEIVNLGPEINTAYPEYGPVVSADETELIFTSNRPNTIGGQIDPIDGLYFEDVYITTKKAGKWSEPLQMSTNINSVNHDASIALSPDGQTMFLYRFDMDTKTSNASGDLYTSVLEGNVWAKAEKLSGKINSEGWEPSASITEDGKTLYFTSNKPGGLGGTDLYYSKKLSDGSWDKPVSMGNLINTSYDEDCPFIHPDGKTLYFSSKGHNTMGGFDVFVTKFDAETKQWTKPVNYGYPISTAHDDLHFVFSANAKRIYFSSTRIGGYGNKDIYYANIGKKEAAKVLLMSGIISDSLTGKPLEVMMRIKDKATGKEIETHVSNSYTGKYTLVLNHGINYEIFYSNPKYGTSYDNLDLTKDILFQEIEHNVFLVNKSREVTLTLSDLVTKKGLNAKIKLMNLDTREEITLGELEGREGKYTTKLKEGNVYNIEVNKLGYVFVSNEITVPTTAQLSEDSTLNYTVELEPIKEGVSMVLKNIYFATDEDKPLQTSVEELDRVVNFMKVNTSAVIEISAHTDDVGDEVYNLNLSDRRAKEVVNYIVGKGIPLARLKSKGHGKNFPIAKGTSEEERQENRRVELKIVKAK